MPLRLKLNENLWSKLKHTDPIHSLKKTSLYDLVKTALRKEGNLMNVHYATIDNGGEYPYSIKESNGVVWYHSNSRKAITFLGSGTKIIDNEDNLYLLTDNLQEILILLDHLQKTNNVQESINTKKRKYYSFTIRDKNWD